MNDKMSKELPLCPFCGKRPESKKVSIPFDSGPKPKIAVCSCGAFLAINRWGNRPLEDALRATIAELLAENKKLRDDLTWIPVGKYPIESGNYEVKINMNDDIHTRFFSVKWGWPGEENVTHWRVPQSSVQEGKG